MRLTPGCLATISTVNVLYGTLAVAVMLPLTLEAAALVELLGAQVIAGIDRSRRLRPESTDGAAHLTPPPRG